MKVLFILIIFYVGILIGYFDGQKYSVVVLNYFYEEGSGEWSDTVPQSTLEHQYMLHDPRWYSIPLSQNVLKQREF